ncbi:MAG: glycosyltransferase family 9 protein [Rhodospirillales bacterium]|nr:glycosyltransferase family 9 protein [Rhodospirillales bacterium]
MAASRILVIKLGALGDFVQALGPMRAIRDHHPAAELILLTTAAFADLARAMAIFDAIWIDERPRFYQIRKWRALRQRLQAGQFERVYDLQTSRRSSGYFQLFADTAKPQWSGIAKGCSHPHANPERDRMHTQDRQREQLKMAGIAQVPATDLRTVAGDISKFNLAEPFALLVPGGAPHRPGKRWPAENYVALASHLVQSGVTPVFLGTMAESVLITMITHSVPQAISLVGATSLTEIAGLAAKARVAIGNDTGPMHIIAAAGCACVVLFSKESDPDLCAPGGDKTVILRRPDLADLDLQTVLQSCPQLADA